MPETARRNGSELLVDSLIAWGVDTVFGMPGDGINGVIEAIRARIAFDSYRRGTRSRLRSWPADTPN
jgi:thiamine pyrophosphate-dependent acetolactate synthase large subunit-like protein